MASDLHNPPMIHPRVFGPIRKVPKDDGAWEHIPYIQHKAFRKEPLRFSGEKKGNKLRGDCIADEAPLNIPPHHCGDFGHFSRV